MPTTGLPNPLKETIYKQTMKEIVRDKIISMIGSGILGLGDELPSERELAAILSVSRETVRGAVQSLLCDGVVQVSQGARTRVVSLDVGIDTRRIGVSNPKAINGYDLEDVHAARLLVETGVVAQAALHITDADLDRLAGSLASQDLARSDPMRYLICDREFHLTIYYACPNRLLADFVVDLYTYMLDHRRTAMGRRGAIGRSLDDHRAIVLALRARDPAATAAAFQAHIVRIRDTTRLVQAEAAARPAAPTAARASRRRGPAAAPDPA